MTRLGLKSQLLKALLQMFSRPAHLGDASELTA